MKIFASAVLMGIGLFACASKDKVVASTSDGGGQSQGGSGGTHGERGCDESMCEGRTYMGQSLATCCVSERGCGVIVDGNCVAPITIADRSQEAGASPFGGAETVVLDPSCPDTPFNMGAAITLKGCCDKTGVCGASTKELSATAPIPAMCITPKEAERFGQRPEGGAERPCRYPADAGSPADAAVRD
jgi:hypothetical protein